MKHFKKNMFKLMFLENYYYQLYVQAAQDARTYYVSFTECDEKYPYGIDFRTHEAAENLGVPDFQICFPLRPDIAKEILHAAIELAMGGYDFDDGKECDKLLEGANVRFIKIDIDKASDDFEGYRIVLPGPKSDYHRMMFPVKNKFTKNEEIQNPGTRNRRSLPNTKGAQPKKRRKAVKGPGKKAAKRSKSHKKL